MAGVESPLCFDGVNVCLVKEHARFVDDRVKNTLQRLTRYKYCSFSPDNGGQLITHYTKRTLGRIHKSFKMKVAAFVPLMAAAVMASPVSFPEPEKTFTISDAHFTKTLTLPNFPTPSFPAPSFPHEERDEEHKSFPHSKPTHTKRDEEEHKSFPHPKPTKHAERHLPSFPAPSFPAISFPTPSFPFSFPTPTETVVTISEPFPATITIPLP